MPNGVQPPERRLLTPTAGEYWPMDLTLDEERARLRREYAGWSNQAVLIHLNQLGMDPAFVDRYAMGGGTPERPFEPGFDARLRELLVDRVCPREWLDRRLREEG